MLRVGRILDAACRSGWNPKPVARWAVVSSRAVPHGRSRDIGPRGNTPLELPKLTRCEALADPKERLHRCLRVATEKRGRHLKKFNVDSAIHRVAESSAKPAGISTARNRA